MFLCKLVARVCCTWCLKYLIKNLDQYYVNIMLVNVTHYEKIDHLQFFMKSVFSV